MGRESRLTGAAKEAIRLSYIRRLTAHLDIHDVARLTDAQTARAVKPEELDAKAETDTIKLALDRFKTTADAEKEQRKAELDDIEFVDWEKQWPDDVILQRSGQASINGLPPVPPRPCLTINQLRGPIQSVVNQARSARLQLQFAPKGNGATRETAEIFEDIARAIQVDSRAHLARLWALQFAVKGGRGYYRLLTDYLNPEDPEDDTQEIIYKRILNPQTVYFDPFAQEPDFSDARWCFITEDMPWSAYVDQFGESHLATAEDSELTSIGNDSAGWVNGDTEASRTVRVAEYFAVEQTDLGKGRFSRKVVWRKINAVEILEEQDWLGKYIPVVPVVGDEINANGKRGWVGVVRPSKDAQRSYNYSRSAGIETGGLQPRQPFVGYIETIEGYEQWWNQANVRNFGILPVKAVTMGGQLLPVPQRQSPSVDISTSLQLTAQAKDDIHSTTGVPPVSLGQLEPHERSGKAIQALQAQSEQGSSGYLDNLASCSMIYEGKILKDLIPKYYNMPGRSVAAVGADDQRKNVILNAPYLVKNGEPQPVPGWMPGEPVPPGAKFHDLDKGEYSVAIQVGQSHTTRRDAAVSGMGQLAEAAPQLVPLYADKWVENMDFPGAKQIADRLHKQLPPDLQQEGKDQPQIPPQMQQQMQQMQQMLQMMTAELQKKTEVINGDIVKQEYEMKRTEMEQATKLEIAKIQAQTGIAEAEIKAQMADMGNQIALLESMIGNAHAAASQGREHAHQQTQFEKQSEQAQQQQVAQQGHEQQMAAQAQQAAPEGAA